MNNRIFKIIVPDIKRNKLISYPMSGHPLYTKKEAVEVMEKFKAKCADRVKPDSELEIWAESEGCRFTYQDYLDDFAGVRTED